MKHVIIGTAGHVDHGKTTLIQALTGTNPDRLKEEQERGMTIDIGFASLRLPDGTIAGIVDVPGHERFLKNMLAGASGVDVVLLIVAADESVMPQTIEHLDILRLLDVKNGVVAMTKYDLVDNDWANIVEEDIRAQLKGSFLESVPIIRVSSTTGKGIDALKRALLSAVSRADERNASLPFRLPIDRVFTRPGFGTVVTGTLVAGTVHINDSALILPNGIETRVRGIQVHGEKVSEAMAGTRVAINIAGVETEALERGSQLLAPQAAVVCETFDATLRLLPTLEKPFEDRMRVRVHIGTAEIIGRIRLLEGEELQPGETTYIQFRSESQFVALRGDRFVVRAYSPMQTLGGGIVLETNPIKHRKGDSEAIETLKAKEAGTPEDLIATTLQTKRTGILLKDLRQSPGFTPIEVDTALTELFNQNRAEKLPTDRIVDSGHLSSLTSRVSTLLNDYHQKYPLRPGMPKEELRPALGKDMESKPFTSFLNHWQDKGLLLVEGATVRLSEFQITLNERQTTLLQRIEDYYILCGISMPSLDIVANEIRAPKDAILALLRVGVERGKFVYLGEDNYYHKQTIDDLQQLVRDYIKKHGGINVASFRDLTQSNRKFSLLVLEYFDSIRFTSRRGDDRVLLTQ